LVITVDAVCWIWKDDIRNLIGRLMADPANTRAVAGAILICNSLQNWLTKPQEWDYFLGIAAIKRIQSLFLGF
jgi:biofilm PGA synthesis N-glycosyltransferase PgaC